MCIYTNIYIYMHKYLYMYNFLYMCTVYTVYKYKYIYIYVCMYAYIYMYMYVIQLSIFTHVSIYIYLFTYWFTYIIYISVHICLDTCHPPTPRAGGSVSSSMAATRSGDPWLAMACLWSDGGWPFGFFHPENMWKSRKRFLRVIFGLTQMHGI